MEQNEKPRGFCLRKEWCQDTRLKISEFEVRRVVTRFQKIKKNDALFQFWDFEFQILKNFGFRHSNPDEFPPPHEGKREPVHTSKFLEQVQYR